MKWPGILKLPHYITIRRSNRSGFTKKTPKLNLSTWRRCKRLLSNLSFKFTYVLLRCSTAPKQRKKTLSYKKSHQKRFNSDTSQMNHNQWWWGLKLVIKASLSKLRAYLQRRLLASPSGLRTAKSLRTRAWSCNTLTKKLYCCPISSKAAFNASWIFRRQTKRTKPEKHFKSFTSTCPSDRLKVVHCLPAVLKG